MFVRAASLVFILYSSFLLGVLSLDPSTEAEVEALKVFKKSITNDQCGVLLDWNHTNHDCNWSGVGCDPSMRHVISITLVEKQLQEAISPFLGNLSSLGSCTNLTDFILYANSVSGPIPPHLGNLRNLQFIDLGDNFLNGSIPDTLCNCTALLALGLINNNLTGQIPQQIGNLLNLQMFVAYINHLEGSIPSSIGKLRDMQSFDLSMNKLTGKIPPEIGFRFM